MGNFEVIAIQRPTIGSTLRSSGRWAASSGSYVDQVSNPITIALRDALEEPIDPSQILNTAVGFANTVALLALR